MQCDFSLLRMPGLKHSIKSREVIEESGMGVIPPLRIDLFYLSINFSIDPFLEQIKI